MRKSNERAFLALARFLLAYRLVSARTVTVGMGHRRLERVRAPLPALTSSDMANDALNSAGILGVTLVCDQVTLSE